MGKSQTEASPYWPSDSEVNTVGRGLRLLNCLLYGTKTKRKQKSQRFHSFAPSRKFQSLLDCFLRFLSRQLVRNLFLSNRCCPLLWVTKFILGVFLLITHSHSLQFSDKKIDGLSITFCFVFAIP